MKKLSSKELQEKYPVYSNVTSLVTALKNAGFEPEEIKHEPHVCFYWGKDVIEYVEHIHKANEIKKKIK